MYTYYTITEALTDLPQRRYTATFKLRTDRLLWEDKQIRLSPDEFNIDELYRFEGITDRFDETIVYPVSSIDGLLKGTLVNAYGPYADTASAELVSKLKIKRQ